MLVLGVVAAAFGQTLADPICLSSDLDGQLLEMSLLVLVNCMHYQPDLGLEDVVLIRIHHFPEMTGDSGAVARTLDSC